MMTRLARVAVWGLRIVAILSYLYHFLYYGLSHPWLTEAEVFLQKWPWIVAGFGLVVVSEAIDLRLGRQRRRDDAEAGGGGG